MRKVNIPSVRQWVVGVSRTIKWKVGTNIGYRHIYLEFQRSEFQLKGVRKTHEEAGDEYVKRLRREGSMLLTQWKFWRA